MISGKVFDEIKNHPELPTTALGKFIRKNAWHQVAHITALREGVGW
jgi:hypothetical protein